MRVLKKKRSAYKMKLFIQNNPTFFVVSVGYLVSVLF